eukprot:1825252-Pleurochrysis_carterae.AAC.1
MGFWSSEEEEEEEELGLRVSGVEARWEGTRSVARAASGRLFRGEVCAMHLNAVRRMCCAVVG